MHLNLLPDEWAPGAFARYLAVIGPQSKSRFRWQRNRMLRSNLGVGNSDCPAIELLSEICATPVSTIIKSHTLLPFKHAIAKGQGGQDGGSTISSSEIERNWNESPSGHIKACRQCAYGDRRSIGYAYWRLSHQLPGILRCSKHGSELVFIAKPEAIPVNVSAAIESGRKLRTPDTHSTLYGLFDEVINSIFENPHCDSARKITQRIKAALSPTIQERYSTDLYSHRLALLTRPQKLHQWLYEAVAGYRVTSNFFGDSTSYSGFSHCLSSTKLSPNVYVLAATLLFQDDPVFVRDLFGVHMRMGTRFAAAS